MCKLLCRLSGVPAAILIAGLMLSGCAGVLPAADETAPTAIAADETVAVTEAATAVATEPPDTIGYTVDEDGYYRIRPNRYSEGAIPAFTSRHSYDALESDRAREVYDALYESVYIVSPKRSDRDPSFYEIRPVVLENTDCTAVDINAALIALLDDHPELFWLYGGVSFALSGDEYTVIFPLSLYSPEEIIEIMTAMDTAITSMINDLPDDADDYTRERYVHDYLLDTCSYDEAAESAEDYFEYPYASKANGAIVEHAAMCEGYARSFCLLCRQAGLDCVYLCGYANGAAHAWNAVMLDGEWYQVDTTWDDQLSSTDYLNLSGDAMSRDHTLCEPMGEMSEEDALMAPYYNSFIPACTDTRYMEP